MTDCGAAAFKWVASELQKCESLSNPQLAMSSINRAVLQCRRIPETVGVGCQFGVVTDLRPRGLARFLREVVSLIFASWNQIVPWLRRIDQLWCAA